jgi:hypothetical protein
MAKFKHNKKRNTAFLYEILVLELTKSIIKKDKVHRENCTKVIKEFFSSNSEILKDLKVYKTLLDVNQVEALVAEKIIAEAKRNHSQINKRKLISEQSKLVNKIYKLFSKEAFSSFVPNYKNLASIYQIFNQNASIKSRVLLENEIVKQMSQQPLREEKMVPIDNLVLNTFIKKFNEKYNDILFEEQKKVLNKFISSFSDNGIGLKLFLNDEVGRLKEEVKESLQKEEFVTDFEMTESAKKVLNKLNQYKEQNIDKEMIGEILKIQQLVREINSNDNTN